MSELGYLHLHMNLFQYHRFLTTNTSCAAAAAVEWWKCLHCHPSRVVQVKKPRMDKKLSGVGDEWIAVAMKIILLLLKCTRLLDSSCLADTIYSNYLSMWPATISRHHHRHISGQCQSVNRLRIKYSNKMFRYIRKWNYFM